MTYKSVIVIYIVDTGLAKSPHSLQEMRAKFKRHLV